MSAVLGGESPQRRFAEYDSRYRALFERYLSFLCFFYDHHCDAGSYFWQARKLLGTAAPEEAQIAFTRLVSGGADADLTELESMLSRRHDRLAAALHRGRFAAVPEASLFRSRSTLQELDEE